MTMEAGAVGCNRVTALLLSHYYIIYIITSIAPCTSEGSIGAGAMCDLCGHFHCVGL